MARVIKSIRMKLAGHVARMVKSVYRVWFGKPEGKRQHGRPRCRWKDNITMKHQEMGCVGMDWNDLAQNRYRWRVLVNAVMNRRVP
jgi:hypothetical protein